MVWSILLQKEESLANVYKKPEIIQRTRSNLKEKNCYCHLFLPVSQICQLGESPEPAVVGCNLWGKYTHQMPPGDKNITK